MSYHLFISALIFCILLFHSCTHFSNKDIGHTNIDHEDLSTGPFTAEQLRRLAQTYQTPLYVYDSDTIKSKISTYQKAFSPHYPKVKYLYALKANSNISILKLIRKQGVHAEAISAGEIALAIRTGFEPSEIFFTSSSKSDEELKYAIRHNTVINLDSNEDLNNLITILDKHFSKSNQQVKVSFRLNPDINPTTHKHISTGHKLSKFGIMALEDEILSAYQIALNHPKVHPVGIHSHIGSQILDMDPFLDNAKMIVQIAKRIKEKMKLELSFVNLGGGIGIAYQDGQQVMDMNLLGKKIGNILSDGFKDFENPPQLWLEPGRFLVGDSGVLISKIQSVKKTPYRNFINVDTGFNHLARPILYQAYHRTRLLKRNEDSKKLWHHDHTIFDIAGNICETGDILAYDRKFISRPEKDDYIVILDTGAYGFSMASYYNSFNLPAEVLKTNGTFKLIRKRSTLEDILRNQIEVNF